MKKIEPEQAHGTVGKAIHILDTVAQAGRPLRLTEVQALTPYPKATLHRLLQKLTAYEMLTYDPVRHSYKPGLRLVRLAHSAWGCNSLAPVARPITDALAQATGQTVFVAQFDGGQVLYVDRRAPGPAHPAYAEAGKTGPAYCTAIGKAMLAFLAPASRAQALAQQSFFPHTPSTLDAQALPAELDLIRSEGVARNREEHIPGRICLAAPIRTPGGQMLGALSISAAADAISFDKLDYFRPALIEAARGIGRKADGWQFPSD